MNISPGFKNPSKNNITIILLLVAVGLGIYANSFHNKMFWDDDDFILKNQYIKDWRYIPRYFSENVIAGASLINNYWRPLLLLVFSVEWHLWQNWAPGFHGVNTFFHIADSILLFFLLKLLFNKRILAIMTSLVFLVHPVQTETVVYVNSLGDSLSVFFVLGAMILYVRSQFNRDDAARRNALYGLSLLCYCLGLMSKETASILPALLFLCDFFCVRSEDNLFPRVKSVLRSLWPFLVVAVVYVILRATVLNFNNTFNFYKEDNVFTSNLHVRVLTFFHAVSVYFGLLFWPTHLQVERTLPWATSLLTPPVLSGAAISLGLISSALLFWKKRPLFSFGVLWFFLGMLPSSNILIPINAVIYEHWLYLPLVGIFLAFIDIGMQTARTFRFKNVFYGFFIIFLIFLSVRTVQRNADWREPVTFYEQTLRYAPRSYRVINNLAMAYSDAGDELKAEETYKKAIALDPSNPVAHHNLANTYRDTQRPGLAKESYQTALRLDPGFLFSYMPLANLYLLEKDYPGARKILEQFTERTTDKLVVLEILTKIALYERNWAAALAYMEQAAALAPENEKIRADIGRLKQSMNSQMRTSP